MVDQPFLRVGRGRRGDIRSFLPDRHSIPAFCRIFLLQQGIAFERALTATDVVVCTCGRARDVLLGAASAIVDRRGRRTSLLRRLVATTLRYCIYEEGGQIVAASLHISFACMYYCMSFASGLLLSYLQQSHIE